VALGLPLDWPQSFDAFVLTSGVAALPLSVAGVGTRDLALFGYLAELRDLVGRSDPAVVRFARVSSCGTASSPRPRGGCGCPSATARPLDRPPQQLALSVCGA
jgi:hypothetical protein